MDWVYATPPLRADKYTNVLFMVGATLAIVYFSLFVLTLIR